MKISYKQLQQQRGVALVASLIILVIMTLVGLSIFRNNSQVERMASNIREKERALQVANYALSYAENWVNTASASSLTPKTTCATSPSSFQVCNTTSAGATPSSVAAVQTYAYSFKPNGMVVKSGGGVASTGDINYAQDPAVYIYYAGTIPGSSPAQPVYQITAYGFGGSSASSISSSGSATVAVVQSYFYLGASSSSSGSSGTSTSSGATSGTNLGGA